MISVLLAKMEFSVKKTKSYKETGKWKNTRKVGEKSKNFVSPEKWEAWFLIHIDHLYVNMRLKWLLLILKWF